jgi:hypothetical protein
MHTFGDASKAVYSFATALSYLNFKALHHIAAALCYRISKALPQIIPARW